MNKDAVTRYSFPPSFSSRRIFDKNRIVATQKSNVESKCRLNINWCDTAIRHSDENHIVRTIKKSRIGVCKHLTIDLAAHSIV